MNVTPYTKNYEYIKDLDQFFSYDEKNKEMRFIGSELKLYIPQRYEVYDMLFIAETVKTLAVFDMVIDDKYHAGLLMLATIEIEPDDVSNTIVDGIPFLVLTLSKGARFICHTERIADNTIVYSLWMEFITRGKLLYNIGYEALSTLFDQAGPMCGANLNVDHVIFEVIYAHLCRDPENRSIQHRHSDNKDFKLIPLRDVGYATTSSSSKLIGSYFREALNSALIQTSETRHPFEDLLRS